MFGKKGVQTRLVFRYEELTDLAFLNIYIVWVMIEIKSAVGI